MQPRRHLFLTGATGHTGRRLAQSLLGRGDELTVLTRRPERLPEVVRARSRVVVGALEDRAAVADTLRGCDALLAATHIRLAPLALAALHEAGVRRAVFMSSTRRFTKFPDPTADAVREGEEAVEASGLDWTVIRPTMIYGGPDDNNLERLLGALRRWPMHPLPGGGRMLWQPVFVQDVVAAMVAALERPEAIGRAFTVAGPEPVTYREMVMTLLRAAGLRRLLVPVPLGLIRMFAAVSARVMKSPPLTPAQVQRLTEDRSVSIEEAREVLGFAPRPLAEGLALKVRGEA